MASLAFATQPWQLYAAFILMSLGWIGMGVVVISTVLSFWFVRRRGLAISIAFIGASCGGAFIVPLLVLVVGAIGFPAAMLTATAFTIVILAPAVVTWIGPPSAGDAAEPPAQHPLPQTAAARNSISRGVVARRPAFWTISIAFALALLVQIGFIVHQIALLEPKIGRPGAGFAVSLTTAMALLGRLCLGMVIDRLNPRLVTAVSVVSQAAALLTITQTDNPLVLLAACAVFGFSIGNFITLPPLIIQREFEAAAFTVVMGLQTAISGTIGALGPGFIGLVLYLTGGYGAALALCIALQLVAAVVVLCGRKQETMTGVGSEADAGASV
jgi:predicted MFS family arabinose efflux permease